MVNAPAMPSGSPVPTYAAISASVGVPKRIVEDATAPTRWPVAASITQCPVSSVPVRPRMACQRAIASSVPAGLPSATPSRSSMESQPMTIPSLSLSATALALAAASMPTSSPVVAAE